MSFSFNKPPEPSNAPATELSNAQKQELNQEALNAMRDKSKSRVEISLNRLQWFWTVRGGTAVAVGGFFIASYFFVAPVVAASFSEAWSYDRAVEPAERVLPTLSCAWWGNQWRKGWITWRTGETDPGFYHTAMDWIVKCTKKDPCTPFKTFGYDESKASDSIARGTAWNHDEQEFLKGVRKAEWELKEQKAEHESELKTTWGGVAIRRGLNDPEMDNTTAGPQPEFRRVSKFVGDRTRPRALVPMCGDSPIVRELADMGYNVDGVDAAELAVVTLAEKTETAWSGQPDKVPPMHRMHLHFSDIFEPNLWRMLGREQYDLIWDRQGMSAIDPEALEDYAFVLKRSLKPHGVLYVEGTYRTKRIHKNRHGGPPYHFGRRDLERLFSLDEDFIVKCDELKELQKSDLTTEERITGEVPKRLRARAFPCAVWRDKEAAKAARIAKLDEAF